MKTLKSLLIITLLAGATAILGGCAIGTVPAGTIPEPYSQYIVAPGVTTFCSPSCYPNHGHGYGYWYNGTFLEYKKGYIFSNGKYIIVK